MVNNEHVTAMSVKMLATVTKGADGSLDGELDCMYFKEPFKFNSIMSMIKMMEVTFDIKGFPERHLLPRTFKKSKQRFRKHELDLQAHIIEHVHAKENLTMHANEKLSDKNTTFEISVKFRHNAEWQGSIHLVEKDVTEQFSSVVELIKLMDSVLEVEG